MVVRFSVEVDTDSSERVYIVGDHDKLGKWNPDGMLPLHHQFACNGTKNLKLWNIAIDLPHNSTISYRYCVCVFLERADGEQTSVVKRWETNISPRKVIISGNNQTDINLPVDEFGVYDGYNNVCGGWLGKQTMIQLRLQENPIHMHKPRHNQQIYSIKCVPQDYRPKQTGAAEVHDDSNDGPVTCTFTDVDVSILREGDSKPRKQKTFGEVYKQDDYMVFKAETCCPEHLGFHLEFYVCENGAKEHRYVGNTYLLPLKMKHTLGEKKLPIMGLKHKPIGELNLHFMIVKPFNQVDFDMESCFQSHWKSRGLSLDVGHRGMGSSYKKLALVRENTVASLSLAAQNGANLVEFDVMLTKDLHTIVYHDFEVCVNYRKAIEDNTNGNKQLLTIPVKDLTLQELQSMKLSHASSRLGEQIDINGADPADLLPFPTLQQCFAGVDESLGFNIEIKYPLQDATGVWEMEGFMDHNKYIDILLDAVFRGAGSRVIIFSSFDPDCCILLQRKQNKYPVLFLSNGPTQRYTPYMDARARGWQIAMYFALSEGLLGVDLLSECILSDLSIIQSIHDTGLILFVWGDDNNDRENINTLRKNGVDGIIYDRIDFYKPESGKYFEMEGNVLKMETR